MMMQDQEDQNLFQDPFLDEEGFAKPSSSIDNGANFGFIQSIDGVGDPLFDGFADVSPQNNSQLNIMEDFNKIHNNFAGYTFSQISSTYEQHQQPANNKEQQQSQNDQKNQQSKHSKLHSYQEKFLPKSANNNDELLDSDILNNSNEEFNSPKENPINIKSQNQVIDFQSNHPFFFKQQNERIHSSVSNNNLNNIIMNSENLQQSITSTMTIYNSAYFDDASILKILDNTTISEDSIFLVQDESKRNQQQQQSSLKMGIDLEHNFKFECEDVKQLIQNISSKFKDKLQKARVHNNSTHSQSQFIAVSIDEIKQFEALASQAMEKVRQIQSIGKQVIEHSKLRNLQVKNQKQNLKIHIHNQIQKFKDICKKQYKQAEHQRFKNQISEFEWNQKIQQQAEEINKLANKNEQLKYEKGLIISKNESKMMEFDQILANIVQTVKDQEKNDDKKVNKSFCAGTDHSMLLQTKHSKRVQIFNQHHYDLQQSVDEKENESFLSNKGNHIQQLNVKHQLNQLRQVIQDYKSFNQQYRKEFQHQQEVGSYQDSNSIQNLLSNFNYNNNMQIQRDSLIQQSQFIPAEDSQASINRAFIQNDNSNSNISGSNHKDQQQQILIGMTQEDEINNRSIDYKFDENHILIVMDGQFKDKQSKEDSKMMDDLLYLDDKISPMDLRGQHPQQLTETQRMMQENQRAYLLNKDMNKKNQGYNSKENSLEDDLNALIDCEKNLKKKKQQNSNKKDAPFMGDLSGIEANDTLTKNGQCGEEAAGSGKLIFIGDELNGGSIGSRNGNILYSGGSSLLSLNQAFQSNRKYHTGDHRKEIMTIKIQEREIKIPKLNLARIAEGREVFKNNIPITLSSSSSEISQTENSQSQIHNTHLQSKQQNQSSFNNESISKVQDKMGNTVSSIQQDLDKALIMNQSKFLANNSINNSKESIYNNNKNLFDSFKEELNKLDNEKSNEKKTEEKKNSNNKKNQNDTLNLDDISIVEELKKLEDQKYDHPFHNKKESIPEVDKTIDLSHNQSKYKRSLSDSNIIFNDLDLDEELKQKENKDHPHNSKKLQLQEEEKEDKSSQLQIKFKKLKTPQGSQNKIKIKLQNNEEQNPGLNLQQFKQRQQLGQFQQRNRSRSGNSRQNQQQESQESQPVVSQGKEIKKALKILKIKHQEKNNQTQIEESNTTHNNIQNVNITQVDQSVIDIENQSQILPKKRGDFKILFQNNQKRRESAISNQNSDIFQKTGDSDVPHQLVQNYFSAAAAMQNQSQVSQKSQLVQSKIKQNRGSNVVNIKKAAFNSQLEQIKESDAQFENTQKGNYQGQSMMQQMKEYQESIDIDLGTFAKGKNNNGNDEDNCVSPSKNYQRSAQSCTPQKKIIVISKQFIKANSKVRIQKGNNSMINENGESNSQAVLKKIGSQQKRILNKQAQLQHISFLNASVDQSHLQIDNMNQNASVLLQPNDHQLIQENVNPIIAKIQGSNIVKIKKAAKPISDSSMLNQQSASNLQQPSANINLQNLVIPNTQGSAPTKLPKQIFIKMKNQQKNLNDQSQINNSIVLQNLSEQQQQKQTLEKQQQPQYQVNASNYNSAPIENKVISKNRRDQQLLRNLQQNK